MKLPWGTNHNIVNDEFYNREDEIGTVKSLLQTTEGGNSPKMFLTGSTGVGKTVFLKKIKKELSEDYFVVYLDLAQASCFKINELSLNALMEYFFRCLIIESGNKKLNTLDIKIENYFESNNFKIKDFVKVDKVLVPIFDSNINTENLVNFILELPEKIYNQNSDKIKGVIVIIDEFQVINQLGDYLDSFLSKLKSYINNQGHVAYLFSGSAGMQVDLISGISNDFCDFGEGMITYYLHPFSKETVKSYLYEKNSELLFDDGGFEKFFEYTSGIPLYVNTFSSLFPKNILLDEKTVVSLIDDSIYILNSHLISLWTKLNYYQQNIFISLLNHSLNIDQIKNQLDVSIEFFTNDLNCLINYGLIKFENGLYSISEPVLARWLKLEFKNKGIYPYISKKE